jgi:hypothetical protein
MLIDFLIMNDFKGIVPPSSNKKVQDLSSLDTRTSKIATGAKTGNEKSGPPVLTREALKFISN